jgi:hypothetical protein
MGRKDLKDDETPKDETPRSDAAAIPEASPVSDEGIVFSYMDHEHLINLSADVVDCRRLALHVAGRTFQHVAETAEGQWIYRLDR